MNIYKHLVNKKFMHRELISGGARGTLTFLGHHKYDCHNLTSQTPLPLPYREARAKSWKREGGGCRENRDGHTQYTSSLAQGIR